MDFTGDYSRVDYGGCYESMAHILNPSFGTPRAVDPKLQTFSPSPETLDLGNLGCSVRCLLVLLLMDEILHQLTFLMS